MIKSIEENLEHEVSELICLKCLKRWIGVYPSSTLLKDLQCTCGETGFVIKTGQSIEDTETCENCDKFNYNGCKLKITASKRTKCNFYRRKET